MPTQQITAESQINPQPRDILTANRTYYVRTDGDDGNDGLANSPTRAFATIQHAVDMMPGLDLDIYEVTISVQPGYYLSNVITLKNSIGAGTLGSGDIIIQGSTGVASDVVIDGFFSKNGAGTPYILQNMTLEKVSATGSSNAITSQVMALIYIKGLTFGVGYLNHINAILLGQIIYNGACTVLGGAGVHVRASEEGLIRSIGSFQILLSGTPNFTTAFAQANNNAYISMDRTSVRFSGTATGRHYDVEDNSFIYTNGGAEDYFPGNQLGIIAASSIYDNNPPENSRVSTVFVKSSDINLAAITGLTANLLAGRSYQFEVMLFVITDASGGGKYAMGGTVTGSVVHYEVMATNASGTVNINSMLTALGAPGVSHLNGVGHFVQILGVVTTSSPGTLTPQFAERVASGSGTVLPGSYMLIRDVT